MRQSHELYDFYRSKITRYDAQIEAALAQLNADRKVPAQPLPNARRLRARSPSQNRVGGRRRSQVESLVSFLRSGEEE